jgi:hypothetical protein
LKKTCKEQGRVLRDIAKAWQSLKGELLPVIQKAKTDAVMQKKAVHAIDYLRSGLGLRKALKLPGLTHKLYQEWSLIVRGFCTASHSFLCVKRYPHQLHKKEVERIRKALIAPRNAHWPIVSIAATGLHRGSNI